MKYNIYSYFKAFNLRKKLKALVVLTIIFFLSALAAATVSITEAINNLEEIKTASLQELSDVADASLQISSARSMLLYFLHKSGSSSDNYQLLNEYLKKEMPVGNQKFQNWEAVMQLDLSFKTDDEDRESEMQQIQMVRDLHNNYNTMLNQAVNALANNQNLEDASQKITVLSDNMLLKANEIKQNSVNEMAEDISAFYLPIIQLCVIVLIILFVLFVLVYLLVKNTIQRVLLVSDAVANAQNNIMPLNNISQQSDEIGILAKTFKHQFSAVLETSEYYLTVIKSVPSILIAINSEGRIILINEQAKLILQIKLEKYLGQPYSVLFAENPEFFEKIQQAIAKEITLENEELVFKNGPNNEIDILLSLSYVLEIESQQKACILSMQNITELKKRANRISYLANHDALTDLPNRASLETYLVNQIAIMERYEQKLAVLLFDLDNFKSINDRLGHQMGDAFLQAVASAVKNAIRKSDFYSRIGGDEFVVVLPNLRDDFQAGKVARNIGEAVSSIRMIGEQEVFAGASTGIALFPQDGATMIELLKAADVALYDAKNNSKGLYSYFSEMMNAEFHEKVSLEHDMHNAIRDNNFYLEFQPKVRAQSQLYFGVEALLRWRHPTKGVIPPLKFIHIAENTGFIVDIGRWVLKTACETYARWYQDIGDKAGVLSINLSLIQVKDNYILDYVKGIAESKIFPVRNLEFEITESIAMNQNQKTLDFLNTLHDLGAQISIDDFGTGYSALSRLKELPIDTLKIDQSFINEITSNASDKAIVQSIIALSKFLHLDVIAEGVETKEQQQTLVGFGDIGIQGYYYSRPISEVALKEFILKNSKKD